MILKRIVPLPLARTMAAFTAMAALIGGILTSLASDIAAYMMDFEQFDMGYLHDPGWAVVYGPIVYGLVAFAFSYLGALVYNGCARLFGGVRLQLRPSTADLSTEENPL